MPVPDFQSWLLPFLRELSKGDVRHMSDLYDVLAKNLGLSESDKGERLPSGAQFTYMNRIAWARTYLKKAGLVSTPGRSQVKITERGLQVLNENPPRITVSYLKRFPEFAAFHSVRPSEQDTGVVQQRDELTCRFF